MAGADLDRLLAEAQQAYKKGDGRKGARLVNEILAQDLNHTGAWQLLYRTYGKGQKFDAFQKDFVRQFYPNRLAELNASSGANGAPGAAAPKPPKQSFFGRLFGGSRRKQAEAAPPASGAGASGASPTAVSAEPAAVIETGTAAVEKQTGPRPAATGLERLEEPPRPAPSPAPPAPAKPPASQPPSIRHLDTAPPAPAKRVAGRKIQVMVVDDIPQTRETVIRSLRFQDDIEIVGTATNGLQAIQGAKQLQPDVIVMDVNMPDMDGITATAAIKREVPQTEIIILTVQDDVDYLRKSMMAGARDFLAKPPMIEDLIAAIQRAAEFAFKAREAREKSQPAGAAAVVAAGPSGPRTGGRIITVFSPRGGIGSTLVASNLGICLHSDETQVALVDGNLQFGDVPIFFNVTAKNSIVDLAPRVDELEPELVESVMIAHSSGIKILAPPRPERAELVAGPHVGQLLQYMAQLYPYVIVDAAHRLNEITLAVLDCSDLVVLLVSQEVPSISRMRRFMDLAPMLNLDPRKLMMVISQYDKRIGITPEKLSETFGMEISGAIPADSEVVVPAVNRGIPYMLQKENLARPIGRTTQALAAAVKKRLAELDSA